MMMTDYSWAEVKVWSQGLSINIYSDQSQLPPEYLQTNYNDFDQQNKYSNQTENWLRPET